MKTPILKTLCCAGAVLLFLTGSTSLRADQQITAQFNIPIHIAVDINETDCNNSGGPQVTVSGIVAVGGFGAQLIFQNNVKGTHTTVVTFVTNVVLIPLGQTITIPKQPVRGGVGGNPIISIQFYDNNGVNLTGEIPLGRCVQGLRVPQDLLDEVLAILLITAGGCDNHPGPTITFGGELKFSGINARLIFRNNAKGTHTAVRTVEGITIIPENFPVTIPKSPAQGGSGGNPLIYIQLLQGNGDLIGKRIFLGRCNQL
jgi:hypothetical protein